MHFGCRSGYKRKKVSKVADYVKIISFPNDYDLRFKRWVKFLNRQDVDHLTQNDVDNGICSDHFEKKYIKFGILTVCPVPTADELGAQ